MEEGESNDASLLIELSRSRQVRVLYNYRATHNDELNLKVGDVLTPTRTPDGGWWEGTLNGLTGWFPSNYVTLVSGTYP
ncbi:hypothetical protein ACOME3_009861 [Neoechinorhynchus agilis]